MANFLDGLRIFIETWLRGTGLTVPPFSSIFFIFVTLFISLLANALNHLLLDMDAMNKENEIIQTHNANKKLARETNDKKLWIKVQRQDPMVQEIQQKSMMTRMLPTLITYGPFIYIFTTLRETFQSAANLALNGNPECTNAIGGRGSCGGVVILPFDISENFPLIGGWFSPFAGDATLSIAGYGFWYFLSAIVTSSIFLRIFGINLSRNPQQRGQVI